jgi:hypothetical protein
MKAGQNGRMTGLVSTVQNGWVAFFNAGLLVSTRWSLSSPQWLGLSRHRCIGGFKVAILARYFWTRSAAQLESIGLFRFFGGNCVVV